MTAIIDQLTAVSPGPYYDLGGDEVPTSLLSAPQYAAFINKEAGIVTGRGKTVMGWADIAGQGTQLPAGSVAEYWQPAGGKSAGTVTGQRGRGQAHEDRDGAGQPHLPRPEVHRHRPVQRAAVTRA